ncbi:hypothetical protein ES705_25308 [subsurface metagenome]
MRIWTSRYGNQEAIIKSNAIPVRITVGKPRFQLRYELAEEIHIFKPAGMKLKSLQKKSRHRSMEILINHYIDDSEPASPYLDKIYQEIEEKRA